jgi:hypothetical protein
VGGAAELLGGGLISSSLPSPPPAGWPATLTIVNHSVSDSLSVNAAPDLGSAFLTNADPDPILYPDLNIDLKLVNYRYFHSN